jgi:5-enolpyruvylshikimate-3-phosphate synthase
VKTVLAAAVIALLAAGFVAAVLCGTDLRAVGRQLREGFVEILEEIGCRVSEVRRKGERQ